MKYTKQRPLYDYNCGDLPKTAAQRRALNQFLPFELIEKQGNGDLTIHPLFYLAKGGDSLLPWVVVTTDGEVFKQK